MRCLGGAMARDSNASAARTLSLTLASGSWPLMTLRRKATASGAPALKSARIFRRTGEALCPPLFAALPGPNVPSLRRLSDTFLPSKAAHAHRAAQAADLLAVLLQALLGVEEQVCVFGEQL